MPYPSPPSVHLYLSLASQCLYGLVHEGRDHCILSLGQLWYEGSLFAEGTAHKRLFAPSRSSSLNREGAGASFLKCQNTLQPSRGFNSQCFIYGQSGWSWPHALDGQRVSIKAGLALQLNPGCHIHVTVVELERFGDPGPSLGLRSVGVPVTMHTHAHSHTLHTHILTLPHLRTCNFWCCCLMLSGQGSSASLRTHCSLVLPVETMCLISYFTGKRTLAR